MLGWVGSGYGQGPFVPLPQYPVATSSRLAETETGVARRWFRLWLSVGRRVLAEATPSVHVIRSVGLATYLTGHRFAIAGSV